MEQITQQTNEFFLEQLKEELLNRLKDFDINEFDLNDLIRKIKENYIRKQVKKFNVHNIREHNFNNSYSDERKSLNSLKSLKEIKQYIKDYFKQFSKDDRIKELMFNLDVAKLLNKEKKNFYSFSDIKGDYGEEEFIRYLKQKCEKEILFSCWSLADKYRRQEYLRQLQGLLKLLFDIDIEIGLYEDDLKTAEEKINNSQDIKVRLFKGWFYISFKDKEKQRVLFNLALKESLERYRAF